MSLNDAFYNVAYKVEDLVRLGRMSEHTGQSVLESLINGLCEEANWDTPEEALQQFLDTPFIVRAFNDAGIYQEKEE